MAVDSEDACVRDLAVHDLSLPITASSSCTTTVQEHLLDEATSREAATKNSWRTALYFALAESEFCAEGFLLLSET
jgi:hypothetical protein